ncbi:MAG: alpha/beta hydrolase [Bacteroidota bacterium]
MKKLWKWAKRLLLFLLVLAAGMAAYLYLQVAPLPTGTTAVIKTVLQEPLMQLEGRTATLDHQGTKVWYEVLDPPAPPKGTVLLVMGISNDALAWPDYFLNALREQGFRLIRYDNRGTGMSDWVEDWTEETAYSLEDMAADGLAILEAEGIAKAHVMGVSLGGMIAQAMAIQAPEKLHSLTSVMSSAHMADPEMPPINPSILADLLGVSLKYGLFSSESNTIKLQIAARQLLMGEQAYELDTRDIARSVLYNLRKRRGYNDQASQQQVAATLKSGSRYEGLAQLALPVLVIHGKSDPLIDFSHGLKTAEMIPHAQTLWLEGMGHDIPPAFLEEIVRALTLHFEKSQAKTLMDEAANL